MRDTSWKGGKRVNLLLDATGTVQFRQRATLNATDTATTIAGAATALWMKLERVGGTITASHAPDVFNAPGAWVTDGTSTITMNNNLIVGMVVSTDNGAHAFYGNTSVDGYQVHWRSTPGGAGGTLQSSGTGYIRLIRKGNTVNAYKASSLAGPWALNSGNLPVVLTGPLQVGLVVDAASNTVAAIGTFTNFTVTPLNTAPVVNAGTLGSLAPFNLNGTITDDGQPNPPAAVTSLWTKVSGPGTVTFANPILEDTLATLSLNGAYTLRLTADDGDSVTFDDLSFTGYDSPFSQWLATTGTGNPNNTTVEASADTDGDGLLNLLEYAIGTNGTVRNLNPQIVELTPVSSAKYLRLSIPKNPAATDVTYIVEACSDLVSWSSAGLIIEPSASTQLIVRDNVAVSPANRRFMRVRVTRP